MPASPKDRYLEIAAAMVREHVAGEPAHVHLVSHVKLADMARRLGVGRSSLYRMWPSQRDYWHDLVLRAVTAPQAPVRELFALPSTVSGADPDLDVVLDVFGDRMADAAGRLVGDAGSMLRAGLSGYPRVSGLASVAAAAERHERVSGAAQLAEALQAVGRRPIPPLAVGDLVIAVLLMLDGTVIYGRPEPEMIDRRVTLDHDSSRSWSLSGLALRAVLLELTETGELAPRAVPQERGAGWPQQVVLDGRWGERHVEALDVGLEIVAERFARPDPSVDVTESMLGQVTLARVARAAGVTRRQMYHLWPTQAEFRRDLLGAVSARESMDYFRRFDASALDAGALGDRDRIVLEMVDAINAHRRSEGPAEPGPRFAMQPHMRHPLLAPSNRAGLERSIRAQGDRVEALGQVFGMAPVSGLTIRDVTTLILIGAAGSERLHRSDPAAMRYDIPWRGGRYSLFAILNQALVEHVLTR